MDLASNAAMYEPKPIDTSGVKLSPDLKALTERLAENAHDIWARQRMSEGWSVGSERDPQEKKHPCLVPYQELPDSEKDYDRQTALGTLKAMLALGYQIKRNTSK